MTSTTFMELVIAGGSAGGSFALVFVVVRWVANFIAGRLDKRADRVSAATQFLIGQLTGQVETLLRRCNQIEEHHAHCLEELASLRGYVDGRGDARQDAQLIVSAERAADKRRTKDKE